MAAVTLEALRARVREACDFTGSQFVTDGANSLDAFINSEARKLYGILVARYEDYFQPQSGTVALVAARASMRWRRAC